MSARRTLVVAVALLCAACEGPGEEAAGVGEACAESDLISQCPPGSNPILGATAESMCSASASIDLTTESGSVSGRCFGQGTCRVVCQFSSPCLCGVDSVTQDGVFCTSCDGAAACGNGVCEGGETPADCPNDCAGDCTAGQERCQGLNRESCDGTGHWTLLACDAGQACQVGGDGLTSCVRNDIASGGQTGEPVNRQDRVDGRVWFGDGLMPPEGTGTAVVDPEVPSDGYVLESIFFNGWDARTRSPTKDIGRAGYTLIPGDGNEIINLFHWKRHLYPADVDEGDYLVLWGPKRAARYDLLGNLPPEGERQVEVEYPADMAGAPDDLSRGLTTFSVFSADWQRVVWARNCWNAGGAQGSFLRNCELYAFDAATGVNTSLGDTGVHSLAETSLAISADGRSAAVPVNMQPVSNRGFLVFRDNLRRRPLVPSRLGEPAGAPVPIAALSPSGALLATQGGGGAEPQGFPVSCGQGIDLWNLADGKRIYTLYGAAGEGGATVGGVLFDPRGDRLTVIIGAAPFGVANGAPPGIETWDLVQGKERARITLTAPPIVRHLPNGKALAVLTVEPSGAETRTDMTLWDADTGAQLGRTFRWDTADPSTLPSNTAFPDPLGLQGEHRVSRVEGFTFSRRGTRLVVWGQGNSVELNQGTEFVATFRLCGGVR